MRGSLSMKVGRANVALMSAPGAARKSQSYPVSEAKRTQRAALNHQAAGPTKKCFGSARIREERRTTPPNDLYSHSKTNQQTTQIKLN